MPSISNCANRAKANEITLHKYVQLLLLLLSVVTPVATIVGYVSLGTGAVLMYPYDLFFVDFLTFSDVEYFTSHSSCKALFIIDLDIS